MSKSAAIREAFKANPNLTTGQLGELFGCRPEYVRVVLNQRTKDGAPCVSEINRRYMTNGGYKKRAERRRHRWQADPAYRSTMIARVAAYQKRRYASDPKFREKKRASWRRWNERRRAARHEASEHQTTA